MREISLIQRQVLDLFKKFPLKDQFYWTGGTLLSVLYLHHRKSKDLDFFSNEPFSYNEIIGFVRFLKKKLNLAHIKEKKIFDRYEFFLYNKDKLRIEFVFYDHPKIKVRKKWQGIFVDSLDDIAANKIMAFFDRNDPKDLYDLYFLLTKKGYKVKQLLKLVKKKFGVELTESSFWSETYKSMKEIKSLRPFLLVKKSEDKAKIIKKIKNYFINHSTQYLHRLIK